MALALSDQKASLRAEARARRSAAAAAATAAGAAIRELLLEAITLRPGIAISGYWPMRDELDCRPLLKALHSRGHSIGLPVVVCKGRPLEFRVWRPGDPLMEGTFGTQIPPDHHPAVAPEVLLVPLLAFDRQGYRLGYGGGFYDRTLALLKASSRPQTDSGASVLAIGLAFAGQEVPAVPRDETDHRLDWIVTETETIRIG